MTPTEVRRKRRLAIKKRNFYIKCLTILVCCTVLIFSTAYKMSNAYLFKICIDAGHGGYDAGATDKTSTIFEKNLVLDIALRVGEILEPQKIKVIYTRKSDQVNWTNQKESLSQRALISNQSKSDIFVSIHNNDYTSPNIKGVEVWCTNEDSPDEKLAQSVLESLDAINFTTNRGIRYEKDAPLYVLQNTNAPSILIELGFLSNKNDLAFLKSDAGKEHVSQAIALGILNYYTENLQAPKD